jgi:hypothetical protein
MWITFAGRYCLTSVSVLKLKYKNKKGGEKYDKKIWVGNGMGIAGCDISLLFIPDCRFDFVWCEGVAGADDL